MKFSASLSSAKYILVPITIALLVNCSRTTTTPGAPGLLPQASNRWQMGATSESRANPATTSYLYVADELANRISVYEPAGKLHCFINGKTSELRAPDAITFDGSGNLYVANLNGNDVTEYAPCQVAPLQRLKQGKGACPSAVAIGSGDLYVANACANTVTIYQGSTLVQTLSSPQIENPQALAFDSTGVLYVANGAIASDPNGSVAVCTGAPPSRTCGTPITLHVANPKALAVDTTDDLFVANDESHPNGNVTKYQPYASGNGYLMGYGANLVDDPNALVLDSSGDLWVSSYGNDTIYCFNGPPGMPCRVITNGIGNPMSLAIGPSGYLNVANDYVRGSLKGWVTQYCPASHCTSPSKTIVNKINGPVAIGFNP